VEALKQLIPRRRARWNALFAMARVEAPLLDAEVFAGALREHVAPICEVVAARLPDPEEQARVADVLVQTALELCGRDQLGPHARVARFAPLWGRALVAGADAICKDPTAVVPALTNALHHLATTPGTRPDD
jgi:hypothetical protein